LHDRKLRRAGARDNLAAIQTTAAMGAQKLTLYTRAYCHLCADMRAAVEPWRSRLGLELVEVDVDEHPELEARLGEKVPVLAVGDEEICHYFFDEEAFKRCLGLGA
jgi:glutaredoxin